MIQWVIFYEDSNVEILARGQIFHAVLLGSGECYGPSGPWQV